MSNLETATLAGGPARQAVATLAGGCFWCTEAIFKRIRGVNKVTSGYSGGKMDQPSYEQVSAGKSGHAECIQIEFDPTIVTFAQLLQIFWHLIDPTTLNQQGADIGTQYRSVIFYHDEEQQRIAEQSKAEADQSGIFKKPIVTKVEKFEQFYPAEEYHQNYYERNSYQPYCQLIINPKIDKLIQEFGDQVE